MLLMMEHAQRLFSYEKEEGLPPILDLSAEKGSLILSFLWAFQPIG